MWIDVINMVVSPTWLTQQGYANNKFVLAMLQGDSEQIAKLATENDCNYIVLKKEIPLTLDMSYFGFSVLEMTENYVIYKLEK